MTEPESPDLPAVPPPTRSGLETARELLAAARSQARQTRRAPQTAARPTRRNEASQRSGAAPDDRDPQALDATIGRLLAERGWETEAAVADALTRWPLIVGADVAAHCRPESYENGELVVVADSTAWATQLRLLGPQLLRRLGEEIGSGAVRRVRVLGPVAPSWRRGPRSVRGRGPRDTYG